ncbi:MAG: hypothetical protein IKK87_07795 [Bacteroidaceae bacterium]|nr:hypothetical protein [Bacteroidaceae bacterium]
MARNTKIIYGVFLSLALISYLFFPTKEWGPETNAWNMICLIIEYNGGFIDYLELWTYCLTPLLAIIVLFLIKTKRANVSASILCFIPVIMTLCRCSLPDENIYSNNISYTILYLIGTIILIASKNLNKDMSESAIRKRQLKRDWWKKWWWAVVLSTIAILGLNYLSATQSTNRPSSKYGSPNTPTIESFADEVVKRISIIDTESRFKDLKKEYSLDVELSPNSDVVLSDISYGSYKLQLTASFGEFKKARNAIPYQYDILISFPINRNVEQKYLHLYEELGKRLESAGSVDFRYEDIEIISMFDANGFRLTLGKDLYLRGQDDWSDF